MLSTVARLVANYMPYVPSTEQTALGVIMAAAQSTVENHPHINRSLAVDEYEETYSGQGGTSLWLKHWPIQEIDTLEIDGVEIDPLDDTGYVIDAEDGRIDLVGFTFTEGQHNIAITYTAGYDAIGTTPATDFIVPNDLEMALWALTSFYYERRGQHGIKSETDGGYSVSYLTQAIPPEIEGMLRPYKRP